jgi:hypothetical protein
MKAKSKRKPKNVLVLRTCSSQMTSHGGFKWPESGPVSAPDWKPTRECGDGLHGWLWGSGNWNLKAEGSDIHWLVVEVLSKDIIDLGVKVKFPRGEVLFVSKDWVSAMAFIRGRAGYKLESAATGDSGHAAATGDSGHAAATGNSGHAAATGDYGHAAATGYSGHAAATGNYGHAAATGNDGHAAATGYSGHAAATGDYGHAAATGNSAVAAVFGYDGKAKAGKDGTIILAWHDGERRRVSIGYVGEKSIKADTLYRLDEKGKFVEVKEVA